jgi:hypothetical protein
LQSLPIGSFFFKNKEPPPNPDNYKEPPVAVPKINWNYLGPSSTKISVQVFLVVKITPGLDLVLVTRTDN